MSAKTEKKESAEGMQDFLDQEPTACQIQPEVSLRHGMICPRCFEAKIDYNGLLHLVCPNCGLTEAGACT